MRLEGIHHVTAITGDAPNNVMFYVGLLGLRMVKKTVNQDDPSVYHLFYADEKGSPGADLTFFEYPGAPRGQAGDGMIHRVVFRVGAAQDSLDFWMKRLSADGLPAQRSEESLLFSDPEGLALEFVIDDSGDEPLLAEHPDIPLDHAIRGFDGVRAFSRHPEKSASLLEETLSFERSDQKWIARGDSRGGFYSYDPAPAERPLGGAGTVHHIAWASPVEQHSTWRERVVAAGVSPTPIIDRYYFRSIYFREPSGVLFEIATLGPGFTADEDLATLGQRLSLPPDYEHLREKLEGVLTPLPDPRSRA